MEFPIQVNIFIADYNRIIIVLENGCYYVYDCSENYHIFFFTDISLSKFYFLS